MGAECTLKILGTLLGGGAFEPQTLNSRSTGLLVKPLSFVSLPALPQLNNLKPLNPKVFATGSTTGTVEPEAARDSRAAEAAYARA